MEYVIKVLDLYVKIKANYQMLTSRLTKYLVNDFNSSIDIVIDYNDEDLNLLYFKNPTLTKDEVEYILTETIFYKKILEYDAMLLHASGVVVDNKAYLFSASSGVGKSTHTSLYLKNIKDSYIINDDKPAIKIIDNKVMVYGTPWSGKNDINENKSVELQGICFIKQGLENSIEKISGTKAISKILKQTLTGLSYNNKEKLLKILNVILSKYNIYELTCNISNEAFMLSYNTLKENGKNEN